MTQFESDVDILKKITTHRSNNYDQIRILGGTSFNEEHYSGVFLFTYDKVTKKIYFLGVPYRSTYYKDHESNEHTKLQGEAPKDTGRRETFEECGYLLEKKNMDELRSRPVPNRNDKTKLHYRYFYFTDKFSGTLSDFGFGPNPIDGETSTALWISAKIFKEVLYRGHQASFDELVSLLRNVNIEYYDALKGI